MCRFLAYRGDAVFLSELVCAPTHSLVHQSLHASEAKTGTNGDGFGIGWYGERPEPGLYRDVRPAWSDENLASLSQQVRARTFFAHVRASTGTATTRANCHPFARGRHLFMHNGQVGGYARIKRRLDALIPDDLYDARQGTTDSEAIFLLALANGLAEDPVGAALTAYRWAGDGRPPSLYYRETERALVGVSEPIDGRREGWVEVPRGCTLQARPGGGAVVTCLDAAMDRLAA